MGLGERVCGFRGEPGFATRRGGCGGCAVVELGVGPGAGTETGGRGINVLPVEGSVAD